MSGAGVLTDSAAMARAFALARGQAGRTGANPAVGCVICGPDGAVLAEGATGDGGRQHAEELALAALDGRVRNATAYVTLEPCRARSAGGASCSEQLLAAGITRLVCAIADPHPNGAGGLDRLRAGGVRIEIGLMEAEARALYAGFFSSL